ncbi:MAG TPA: putative Fe-S cluster assembly protein SufT [Candidatus Aquilonibacter sp.]|nr:putative Fe-S cluster assembly protein SufT [Candidatus Aquilonibacter sp.]
MNHSEPVTVSRNCAAIGIPTGISATIPAGTSVRVMQHLGTGYTVVTEFGQMFRIDNKDADAIGLNVPAITETPEPIAFSENLVWDQMKTVFDPEIPVNIVDLGLIYSCLITPLDEGGKKIDVKMSMTAPGCGMGDVLKRDVETKIARVPEVKEVNVEVVFDPPWNPGRMSEAARLQLGFDL